MAREIVKSKDQGVYTWFDNNWSGVNLSNWYYKTTRSSTAVGSTVDFYKSKLLNNESATSNFSYDGYKLSKRVPQNCVVNLWNWNTSNQSWDYYKEVARGFPFDGPLMTFAHLNVDLSLPSNQALVKIRKRISETQSHMNGYAFLGELPETMKYLYHTARAVKHGVLKTMTDLETDFEKIRRFRSRRRPMDTATFRGEVKNAVAHRYLEWTFGLKPLLNDTEAIAESIARWQYNNSERPLKVTGTARGYAASDGVVYSQSNRPSMVAVNYQRRTTFSVRYRAGLTATTRLADGAILRLKETLGFTPENFIPGIWEVLPWSWLVDYFVNVGEIIEAGATNTSSVRWVNSTSRRLTMYAAQTQHMPVIAYDKWKIEPFVPMQVHSVRKTILRTIEQTLPYPTLRINNPFGSVGKVANMAAVWAQQQGRYVGFWKTRGKIAPLPKTNYAF